MQQGQIHTVVPYIIGGLLFVVLLAWRLRRMTQSRPLKIEWLWVTPAILAALTVVSLAPQPPQGMDWAYLAVALVIGAGLGWWRGKMMQISIDPQTHALNTKSSAAGMFFIVALIVLRSGARYLALGQASSLHLSVSVITGFFLVMAVGLFGTQRIEMAIRARRMLVEARQARAAVAP